MIADAKLSRSFTYSPLRYPGGKAILTGYLGETIKRCGMYNGTYVEPYAGGAGAALGLLFSEQVRNIVINDLDPAIYAFWYSALFNTDELINKIMKVSVSVREWRKQHKIYKERDTSELFALGFAAFFLNRTNRSGIIEGWPIGGVEQTGAWKINARFGRPELARRIARIGAYRDRIEISNLDAISVIRKHAKRARSFIYLDPPYFRKGGSLYLNHYIESDHRKLATVLNKRANSAWLLTYDNVAFIKGLYTERKMCEFSLRYSANKNIVGEEVMVYSDKVMKMLAEEKKGFRRNKNEDSGGAN